MYSEVILSTHVFVPKNELRGDLRSIKDRLTVASTYKRDDGSRAVVPLWVETATHLGIPRYYYKDLQSIATDVRDGMEDGQEIVFHMREGSHPKQEQQDLAVDRLISIINTGGTGVILVAPTGWGKTVCLLKMIQVIGRTTLVVVPKDDLVDQWVRRILKHTTLSERDIGIIQQDVCDFQGKKIVIGMMHSLALRKKPYPKSMYQHFGCVIHDECHKVGAEQLGRTSTMFPARYRLGASATPKRKDGMTDILTYHIGQYTVGQTKDDMPAPRVIIRSYGQSSGPVWAKLTKLQRKGKLTSLLANNLKRNMLVAEYIHQIYHTGRNCIMFTDRLEQINTLWDILVRQKKLPAGKVGKYVGGVTDAKRVDMAKHCQILLATYGAMDLGTDIPKMSTLVFGTPRSSVTQIVGRIRRILEGKEQPVVIDIVDVAYKDCINSHNARVREYRKMSAELIRVG